MCKTSPYHKTSNLPSKEMLVPWNSVLEPLLQVRRLEPAFPEPVNLPLSAFPLGQWRHANFVAGMTSIRPHKKEVNLRTYYAHQGWQELLEEAQQRGAFPRGQGGRLGGLDLSGRPYTRENCHPRDTPCPRRFPPVTPLPPSQQSSRSSVLTETTAGSR